MLGSGELSSEAFLEASIHITIALITQDEIQILIEEYIDTISNNKYNRREYQIY